MWGDEFGIRSERCVDEDGWYNGLPGDRDVGHWQREGDCAREKYELGAKQVDTEWVEHAQGFAEDSHETLGGGARMQHKDFCKGVYVSATVYVRA